VVDLRVATLIGSCNRVPHSPNESSTSPTPTSVGEAAILGAVII
jgi:hypothetical protein